MPTPPVAVCTKTRSPARSPPSTDSPYSAVRKTTGTPAAAISDSPGGTCATTR
jgi:hypothetical protein